MAPTVDRIRERLEELRAALRAECMSYGELAELQGLVEHIEPGDVELLEAAGVPETVERHDVTYTVEVSMPDDSDGDPDPEEIRRAIYRGVRGIDSEDAVHVEREG